MEQDPETKTKTDDLSLTDILKDKPLSSHCAVSSNTSSFGISIPENDNKAYKEKNLSTITKFLEPDSAFCDLTSLNLSGSCLGNKGVRLLTENKEWCRVQCLDVSNNNITKEGARFLGVNASWKDLLQINLSGNKLESSGIKYIAEGSAWVKLQLLDLSRTFADEQGMKAFAENRSWNDLQELYLDQNVIKDVGALCLSLNISWHHLQTLSLLECEINREGARSLGRNRTWKNLKNLRLHKDHNAKEANLNEFSYDKSTTKYSSTSHADLRTKPSFRSPVRKQFCCFMAEDKTPNSNIFGAKTRFDGSNEVSEIHLKDDQEKIIEVSGPRQFEDQPRFQFREDKYHSLPRGGAQGEIGFITSCLEKMEAYKTKILHDPDLKRDLLCYIRVTARASLNLKIEPKDLEFDLLTKFFSQSSRIKSLLLLGQQGSGKSLFCRYLQQLIFINHNQNYDGWYPVLIPLSSLQNPHTSAISEILFRELNLTNDEINSLKEMKNDPPRIVFICDGYDEISENELTSNLKQKSFYEANGFGGSGWKNHKVIITCDLDTISANQKRNLLFGPVFKETGQPLRESYAERIIAPFSEEGICAFLEKFNKNYPLASGEEQEGRDPVEKYNTRILKLLNKQQALNTPSLISIIAQVLPEISTENSAINERLILHAYINKALKKCVLAVDLAEVVNSEQSALSLLRHQAQKHALELSHYKLSKGSNDSENLEEKKDALLMRCLLLRKVAASGSEIRYEFIHKILQDFLVAEILENEISDSRNEKPTSKMLFDQKSIRDKTVIVNFLIQALKADKIKDSDLLKLVEYSRSQQKIQVDTTPTTEEMIEMRPEEKPKQSLLTAATNAMFILNISGFSFTNLDLRDVQIPGVNLKGGNFSKTDFTGADLSGVNFEGATLCEANLKGANLTDTFFGEWNYVSIGRKIGCLAYSPDSKYLLAAGSGTIFVLELDFKACVLREIRRFQAHCCEITSCRFSFDGKLIVTSSIDGNHEANIKVWDFEGFWPVREYCKRAFRCAFVPNSQNIIVANRSENFTIHYSISISVWDTKREIRRHKLIGHTELISALAFSHDCLHLVSCSEDKTVLVWNIARSRIIRKFKLLDVSIQACYFNTDNKIAVLINRDEASLEAFDLLSGKRIADTIDNRDGVVACAFKSDQKYIAYSDRSGVIRIFSGKERHQVFKDVNIESAFGLSDNNILLFQQQGDYKNWTKDDIQKYILNHKAFEVKKIKFSFKIRIQKEDAALFRRNTTWINLETLELERTGLNSDTLSVIVSNTIWKNLKVLNLGQNKIDEAGAAAIVRYKSWRKLEELSLSKNEIGYRGAAAIADNEIWKNLQVLNLEENKIGDKGAAAIARNESWENLRVLNLESNGISDEGVAAIARNESWEDLRVLNFKENIIGNQGAAAIARNESWENLRVLNLDSNRISDEGAAAIARNATWRKLEKLSLTWNKIEDEGSSALASNTIWKNLNSLLLHGNKGITEKGKMALQGNSLFGTKVNFDWTASDSFQESIDPVLYASKQSWSPLGCISWFVKSLFLQIFPYEY